MMMISILDSLNWYALGMKGHTHLKKCGKKGYKLYENKNVTYTQDFISEWANRHRKKSFIEKK